MKRTEATAVENSNANVDEKSFSGREKEASADVQKVIALDYTLSPEVSQAHKNMLLYQHDLEKTNIGQHNCLFVDMKKLFTNGFVTRNGDVRPPSNFSSACQ
jgi:ribonucleoside-triphosphate reductase